jgi:hypothetical protein
MLVLGKTESVQGYTDRFDIEDHSDFVINKLKNS